MGYVKSSENGKVPTVSMLKKDGYLNNITNSDFNKELKIEKQYTSYTTHRKQDIHVMDHIGDYERIANEITNEVPHSTNPMHIEKRDPKSFTIRDDMRFDTHAPIDMLPLSRKVREHADVYVDPRERKDLLEQDTRYDNYVQEQSRVSFTSYPLSESSKRNIEINTQENKQSQTVTYNPHTTMETKKIKLGNPNVKHLLDSISSTAVQIHNNYPQASLQTNQIKLGNPHVKHLQDSIPSTAVKSVQIHNNYPQAPIQTNKHNNTSSINTEQKSREKPNIHGAIQGGNHPNPVSVSTTKYEMGDLHNVKITPIENLNVPFRQEVPINSQYTSGTTNTVLQTKLHLNTQNNTKSIPTSHLEPGLGDVSYSIEEHGRNKLNDTQVNTQPRHISTHDKNHISIHQDSFSTRHTIQLNTNKKQQNHDTHISKPVTTADCIKSVNINTSHRRNKNGTMTETPLMSSNLQDTKVYLQSDYHGVKGSQHISEIHPQNYEPIEAYIQTQQSLPLQNEQQEIGIGQITNKAHIQLNTSRREQKDNINDKYGEHNININNKAVHVTSQKNEFVHMNEVSTPAINTKKMQGLTYFNNKRDNNPHTTSKNNIKLKSTTPTASFETRGYISTFE